MDGRKECDPSLSGRGRVLSKGIAEEVNTFIHIEKVSHCGQRGKARKRRVRVGMENNGILERERAGGIGGEMIFCWDRGDWG